MVPGAGGATAALTPPPRSAGARKRVRCTYCEKEESTLKSSACGLQSESITGGEGNVQPPGRNQRESRSCARRDKRPPKCSAGGRTVPGTCPC